MNKWLLLLVFLLIAAFGWFYARTYARVTPTWLRPKFGEVTRGDIRVPITASGLIRPRQEIEIKPEASGKVIEVPVLPGKYVRAGEPLVVLNPENEQRSVTRATSEVERLTLQVQQADNAIATAAAQVKVVEAQVADAAAQLAIRKADWQGVQDRQQRGDTSALERITAEEQVKIAEANLARVRASLEVQHVAVKDAENSKAIQERLLESAKTTLGDAEKRLKETTVRAPRDGIVTTVNVREGNVVQSGTESFTGGTVVAILGDVSTKIVVARVDESDYGRVLNISPVSSLPEMPGLREAAARDAAMLAARAGMVKLNVDTFPEKHFAGRITRVEPQGKLSTGSSIIQYDVHIEITDPEAEKLPLGSQAQVEFTVESASDALRVPSEAVKSENGQRGIWLKTDPTPGSEEKHGKRFLPCQFGISDGEFTEVVRVIGDETLKEGQEIYTKVPAASEDEGE